MDVLTEAVAGVMTPLLEQRFGMESDLLTVFLFAAVVSALVLVFVFTVQEVYAAARVRIITPASTKLSRGSDRDQSE